MHDFAVVAGSRDAGRRGSFDHYGVRIGRRSYDLAAISEIVLPSPGRTPRGLMAALAAAGGAALGGLFGRALGAGIGAAAGALSADLGRSKTHAALVFRDGLVLLIALDAPAAGALAMMRDALADLRRNAGRGALPPRIPLRRPAETSPAFAARAELDRAGKAAKAAAHAAFKALRRVDLTPINPLRRRRQA